MKFRRRIYLDDRPWEEALALAMERWRVTGALRLVEGETVPTREAAGRVLAEPVFARRSVPHFHAAAMDGIAVRARDTYGASETSPRRLRVGPEACFVDTGDPLPSGFDAVIMIEDVQPVGGDAVEIIHAASPWQHVRPIGEDIVQTELVLGQGRRVRPADMGALLNAGVDRVVVRRRPRVALIPTGSELREPGAARLGPGEVAESNTAVQAAMVREWGGEPWRLDIVPDDPDRLRAAIREAAAGADVVAVNAGSSAGSEDYTHAIVAELGEVLVHGIATRPGNPMLLGTACQKPLLGIPGYPVSAAITFELFCRPVVAALLGTVLPERERVPARITRRVVSTAGWEEFLRVTVGQVGDRLLATPVGRGAGALMTMVRADGLVRIPRASQGLEEGQEVWVELYRPLEEIRRTVVAVGSHDLALDVLGNLLRELEPGAGLTSAHVGSLGGFVALRKGEAHLAGVHLLDEETGEYNLPFARRLLPGRRLVLYTLVEREQGLIVAPGNPKGIRAIADLTRPDVVFCNRQRGAGTRTLLDVELRRAGIRPDAVRGYEREEFTHMAVAARVAGGAADAGLGILAAARALGLDFVPVATEPYELCIPAELYDSAPIRRLLGVAGSAEFRRRAEALGGYHLGSSGSIREVS